MLWFGVVVFVVLMVGCIWIIMVGVWYDDVLVDVLYLVFGVFVCSYVVLVVLMFVLVFIVL